MARAQEHYGNLSEDEEINKRNYGNTKNKNMLDVDRERKKVYEKLFL